ncbi:MAG: ThiF family adenylyltransferase [Candidatus Buchananbacteria bacterium]|nr:ThiF family adenylyltransferase [Candidatus Buchananbacteria bacterium]
MANQEQEIVRVDYWRQLDLFDPGKFQDEVHVIGVGATGSYVAYLLAKMGVQDIHVYDFDEVEDHNLPNQVYRLKDVGRPKVEALQEIILEATGIGITAHNEAVTANSKLKGVIFLMVDSMDIRRDIWDGALKFKLPVKFMVETRMAIDNGRVYAILPSNLSDIRMWESTLYSDEEAEESPCTNRSISPTVSYIASVAVWKLIKWFNGEDYQKELIVCARPMVIIGDGVASD